MHKAFVAMLTMQDQMNRKVHPDWVNQHFEWYRALWLECGELIDHYGYKWWKKQTPEMEQVKLEVIDIWHFGMSMLFDGRNIDSIAADMLAELEQSALEPRSVLEATEDLAADVLSHKRFSVARFAVLLDAVEMNFDRLYEGYIGKNVLNFFRQDNGYKQGSYCKQWDGREDNEHLVEIVQQLDCTKESFAADVYDALEERYKTLTRKTQ